MVLVWNSSAALTTMKAGLVMNMFVLAAFKRFGGAPAPLLARLADAGQGFEPGLGQAR